jgi:hypothetical protein
MCLREGLALKVPLQFQLILNFTKESQANTSFSSFVVLLRLIFVRHVTPHVFVSQGQSSGPNNHASRVDLFAKLL